MEGCLAYMEPQAKMRRTFRRFLVISASLILVAGNLFSSDMSNAHISLGDVERALRNAGLHVTRGTPIRQPYLHAPGTVLIVNGENGAEVQTYLYPNTATRLNDSKRLRRQRCRLRGMRRPL